MGSSPSLYGATKGIDVSVTFVVARSILVAGTGMIDFVSTFSLHEVTKAHLGL